MEDYRLEYTNTITPEIMAIGALIVSIALLILVNKYIINGKEIKFIKKVVKNQEMSIIFRTFAQVVLITTKKVTKK